MIKDYRRSLDELQRIVADTAEFFRQAGVDPALRLRVDLSIEELFVNMLRYNAGTRADIRLELKAVENGVEVILREFGAARFDPRDVRPIDPGAPLSERAPGGLGLYLVLKMADSIDYEYHDRVSTITMRMTAGRTDV